MYYCCLASLRLVDDFVILRMFPCAFLVCVCVRHCLCVALALLVTGSAYDVCNPPLLLSYFHHSRGTFRGAWHGAPEVPVNHHSCTSCDVAANRITW